MSNITNSQRLTVFATLGTGVNLLVVLIYGGLAFFLVAIFVQRALTRIVPKYSKGHADVGKFATKSLKADIDKRLQQTLYVAFEPRLLADNDPRCRSFDGANTNEIPRNYLYRMKAVDSMKKLEQALEQTDETLKRHPLKDLRQHLRDIKSHSSGILRAVRSSQMKALTDAYEHARYKPENFGEKEYQKFKENLDEVLSSMEVKTKKRRTKKQQSQRNSNNSRTEKSLSSDKEPLLVHPEHKKK